MDSNTGSAFFAAIASGCSQSVAANRFNRFIVAWFRHLSSIRLWTNPRIASARTFSSPAFN
jgi:hypothetical protein